VAAAPDDLAARRDQIDALRLAGERDAARGYVTKIVAQTAQPETAYVLAALDLTESAPIWTTVLDRLRLAASAEGGAGRARAALVYALMKAGKPTDAKAELAKLDSLAHPYPLTAALHAFVDPPAATSAPAGPSPSASSSAPPSRSSGPATLPQQVASPPVHQLGVGAGGSAGWISADSAAAMQAASRAVHKGDWSRARQIYETIVSRNQNDSEALAGIGDVARAQGDLPGAIRAYKRTLAVNPSYLPALLGLADTEWASGDRASAARTYKTLVDHFPDGTYPTYAKARAEPTTAESSRAPAAAESAPETSGSRSPNPIAEADGGGA
ncbi:MAG: tetratricopeptide repeat protein, partial [Myxococcota bacterium]|nr:tetratricopeptide repeat protein [Myxococcota bacterium]